MLVLVYFFTELLESRDDFKEYTYGLEYEATNWPLGIYTLIHSSELRTCTKVVPFKEKVPFAL
jgi:hypothetical protein